MKIKNLLTTIILMVVPMLAFTSCSGDEPVDTKDVVWQDKGVYFGTETNHIKGGLLVRYSSNATNQTLVQINPVIYNDGISNDMAYPMGGAFFWLPPLASRYQMELYSSNRIAVPKTSKGKMFGQVMNVHPKTQGDIAHGQMPFKEPGYQGLFAKLDETNQIGTFGPVPEMPGMPHPFEPFILQDMFKITELGKYRLVFEIRSLMRKRSMYSNFEPYYLPVNVEIEIKKP